MNTPLAYFPGKEQPHRSPLARFLPRVRQGVVATWLAAHVEPGDWVLDPFGASPHLAAEAARAGYRVIVAANNPIARFLIELAANPPSENELRAVLAELSSARRGDERIEPHILSLYSTHCDDCGQPVTAERFVWERDVEAPHAKVYHCAACGHGGEHPTNDFDKRNAQKYAGGGPHLARALERVAPLDDPNRAYAEEALEAYPPRAVYALFNLINKFSGLRLNDTQKHHLSALMLAACDRASSLWPVGSKRRPRQLGTPSKYYEHNIWLALETAIPLWATGEAPVALTVWPEQPPESGGICLYEGKLKTLVEELDSVKLSGVVTALPRPNQAYWTLSALWAGWLWGREEIGLFTSVLRRRRYDWSWHTTALSRNLSTLSAHLPYSIPFYGLVTESEPGFDTAVLLAADIAGFSLLGLAARPQAGQTQLYWTNEPKIESEIESPLDLVAGGLEAMRQRAEPIPYLHLLHGALGMPAQAGTLGQTIDPDNAETTAPEQYNALREKMNASFRYTHGFTRMGGSEKDLNTGVWWLRNPAPQQLPLTDRVEKFIVQLLLEQPREKKQALDAAVCAAFPLQLTPEAEILDCVLESYGDQDEAGGWHLKASDHPKNRRADLIEMREQLRQLGTQLGYAVEEQGEILLWGDSGGKMPIIVMASALIAEPLLDETLPGKGIIVLPGGRAGLTLLKQQRDPRLAQLAMGWQFIKFRMVRRLAPNPPLTRETFYEVLGLDPLSEENTQLPLF